MHFSLRVLLVLFLLSAKVQAGTPPSRLLAEYSHTAWAPNHGAPADVQAISQSSDGWLWISTQAGLYRFDGTVFQRMDRVYGAPLLSTTVLPIYAPPDGGLWVGYRFGGASFFKDGKAWHYGTEEGFPPGAAMSFTRAPDGTIWATATGGVASLREGRWRQEGAAALFEPRPFSVRQVLFDRKGIQWVSTADGIYYRAPGTAQFGIVKAEGVELWSIAEGPDGVIWASDGKDGNYRIAPDGPRPRKPELPGSGMWFDRSGAMWLLRQESVEKRSADLKDDEAMRITLAQGLSGNSPQTFHEDREGNIWIGTAKGLDRFHPNRFKPLPYPRATYYSAIIPDADKGLWIGDWMDGTVHLDAEGRTLLHDKLQFNGATLANDGTVLLGTDQGVLCFERGHRRLIAPPEELSTTGTQIRALAQAGDGSLWASFLGKGIYLHRGGAWIGARTLYPSLPDERVMHMAADSKGRVWIGYIRNRLAIADGRSLALHQPGVGNVLSFFERNGHHWLGGEQGLAWFDGQRFHIVRKADGTPFRGIAGIVETPQGELWLHGYEGLHRIAAADVKAVFQHDLDSVTAELFSAQDGLLGSTSPVGPFPTMHEGRDGRLWLTTSSNIISIDPREVLRNPRPPLVEIRSVGADGKQYAPAARIELPLGTTSVSIDFASVALSKSGHAAFRYQLEGSDEGWIDAGGRHEAFYTNLSPGHYRFRVIAANEDMVWNTQGASIDLHIPPRFVQTIWFKLLCIAAASALAYGALGWRVRQKLRLMQARMQATQQERERVARTLHDTLMQGVQSSVLSMDAALKKLPQDSAARASLERTVEYLESVMEDARDEVIALRSARAQRGCLARSLRQLGELMAESLPPSFAMHESGSLPLQQDAVCENILAIGREAITNAFMHAQASAIAVRLEYSAQQIILEVRDDGRGLPPAGTSAGACVSDAAGRAHWGLLDMRERAALIGATLAVRSGATGTTITLTCPVTRARPEAPEEILVE